MKPYRQFTAEANQLNHFTEAAKERLFTGPGKSDPKRLIGVYTKSGKWIKDMKSEREARKYVDATYESVQEAKGIPNPNTVPGQNPKPVQGDPRIAPKPMTTSTARSKSGIPNPNTVPGQNPRPSQDDPRIAPKPMTMAQRHTEIQRSGKGIVKFMRTIVADWKSGNMALSRMESVMFNLAWLRGATLGYDPASDRDYKAVAAAFRKKHPEADRILRLGKGGGFNPSMGKVTPNEITRTFEAILAFIETDIPAMKKAGTISAAWDPMGTPFATESVMEITNPAYVPGQNPRPSQDDPRVATPEARLDDRYYYAVYASGKLREINGPYKSEQSAWDDHGGDMDEILRGDALKKQMEKGKYKDYTIRLNKRLV